MVFILLTWAGEVKMLAKLDESVLRLMLLPLEMRNISSILLILLLVLRPAVLT